MRSAWLPQRGSYANNVVGFKSLTHAQLLSDAIYFSPYDGQNWLVYYISRPLVGAYEDVRIISAVITQEASVRVPEGAEVSLNASGKRQDIKSFGDLLNNFPMIARQMQHGLEQLFSQCNKSLSKALPPLPSSPTGQADDDILDRQRLDSPTDMRELNGHLKTSFHTRQPSVREEDHLKRTLEVIVMGAIDLFQSVDKQQLSFLGATTELTGTEVERLIEHYMAEQVHDHLLFPRICSLRNAEDQELDRRIRQMSNIDISQVGIANVGNAAGKHDLLRRLNKGVEAFRKMSIASSPQETLKVLLQTEKAVTEKSDNLDHFAIDDREKAGPTVTVNADVLVSLLLVVVIRAQIRHLHARLLYMQRFIFLEDVESGEIGYALSTFEAVLLYLMRDAGGLRRASARNQRLWDATKAGDLDKMRSLFEIENGSEDEAIPQDPEDTLGDYVVTDEDPVPEYAHRDNDHLLDRASGAPTRSSSNSIDANLSHVFPFEATSRADSYVSSPKKGKKVSIDLRSLSGSSAVSFHSRTTTVASIASGFGGDSSIETLSSTQDPSGNSVLMMAVEAGQSASLRYLLSLSEFYSPATVMHDATSEETTLLSAAIQVGYDEPIGILLQYISDELDVEQIKWYLARADCRGRTAAHYLFTTPQYLSRLSRDIPWTKKDHIGQTPLFALCRSYDHPDYGKMVVEALRLAAEAQDDGGPLHVANHCDNKGNTLLHIVNEPALVRRILQECDVDPNATNNRSHTSLMLASKYGRIGVVQVLFEDARVDVKLKEARGLTAVELAKDDEVRYRIDDLTLCSGQRQILGNDMYRRVTSIVRSYFVEDATMRFVVKSGRPAGSEASSHDLCDIATSRRTLPDFERLAQWLAQEHPASYLPTVSSSRNPFQIPSKPSRAVLHDLEFYLDQYLKCLLAHPTFGIHETVWEFVLMPDLQSGQMTQRAKMRAENLAETVQDEYEPLSNIGDVEKNNAHSQYVVQSLASRSRLLVNRGHGLHQARSDLAEALSMSASAMSTLGPPSNVLPQSYTDALKRHAYLATNPGESSPLKNFVETVAGTHTSLLALQRALARPQDLITDLSATRRSISQFKSKLANNSLPRRFNLPGMEESRRRTMLETEHDIRKREKEIESLLRELRWNTEVVVGELAGWTAWRERVMGNAIKELVRWTVVKERERLRGLERCLRAIRERC